jgi:hypothetical protein
VTTRRSAHRDRAARWTCRLAGSCGWPRNEPFVAVEPDIGAVRPQIYDDWGAVVVVISYQERRPFMRAALAGHCVAR